MFRVVFRAVFVFSGILSLPQPSPVLLRRRRQNSGVPAAVKGWTIAKDSLPSLELPLQDSDRNTSTTIGKLSQRQSQPCKNNSHLTSDAPPRTDQRIFPPSCHVTRPTRLAHSSDATSATVDHCWLPRQPLTFWSLTIDFWVLTFDRELTLVVDFSGVLPLTYCVDRRLFGRWLFDQVDFFTTQVFLHLVFRPDSIFAVCFCIFCL